MATQQDIRRASAEVDFTLENAAQAVIDQMVNSIDDACAKYPDQLPLAKHLYLKEIWDKLTKLLEFGPDELREQADEMEEREEDDDDDNG